MTPAEKKLHQIGSALEQMLLDDEDITARGLVRRLAGLLNYPSDVTRHPERRAMLEQFQTRQFELRAVMAKADKNSKANLSALLARKEVEIAKLTQQRDILIASHKAMILAVGELGGMKAWRQFFEQYQHIVEEMHTLGALPDGHLVAHPRANTQT